MATLYTLTVVIDNAVLALHSKDSLCISKKVCICSYPHDL